MLLNLQKQDLDCLHAVKTQSNIHIYQKHQTDMNSLFFTFRNLVTVIFLQQVMTKNLKNMQSFSHTGERHE
jgi:hypothetical protein